MALTALAPNSFQVKSGLTPPGVTPPEDPSIDNIYYQKDAAGSTLAVFYWDPSAGWSQAAAAAASANWAEGLVCGWQGPHNRKHYAPAHAEVSQPSALTPRFSVSAVSASAIPFELIDNSTGTAVSLATGVFPAGVKFADAMSCAMVDAGGSPVASFLFSPTLAQPVAHYACVPVGGHTAMPSDGETFAVHFSQVF